MDRKKEGGKEGRSEWVLNNIQENFQYDKMQPPMLEK